MGLFVSKDIVLRQQKQNGNAMILMHILRLDIMNRSHETQNVFSSFFFFLVGCVSRILSFYLWIFFFSWLWTLSSPCHLLHPIQFYLSCNSIATQTVPYSLLVKSLSLFFFWINHTEMKISRKEPNQTKPKKNPKKLKLFI